MNMVVHENVRVAHQFGCAAGKQGKFIEYKTAFWDKSFGAYRKSGGKDPSTLTPEFILRWAPEAGLDATRLKADGESAECQRRVVDDMNELRKFHVNATPFFFVNGEQVGRPSKEKIQEKLAIAEASGVPADKYYAQEIFAKGEKKWRGAKRGSKKGGGGHP